MNTNTPKTRAEYIKEAERNIFTDACTPDEIAYNSMRAQIAQVYATLALSAPDTTPKEDGNALALLAALVSVIEWGIGRGIISCRPDYPEFAQMLDKATHYLRTCPVPTDETETLRKQNAELIKVLHRIAYEPFGPSDASDGFILVAIVELAINTLTSAESKGESHANRL